jgi:hypothetical protein
MSRRFRFAAAGWRQHGGDSASAIRLPKNKPETAKLAAKKTQAGSRIAGQPSKVWNYRRF